MPYSLQGTINAYDVPRIMTPDEELEFAVATLLMPQLFNSMDIAYGWVPKK